MESLKGAHHVLVDQKQEGFNDLLATLLHTRRQPGITSGPTLKVLREEETRNCYEPLVTTSPKFVASRLTRELELLHSRQSGHPSAKR